MADVADHTLAAPAKAGRLTVDQWVLLLIAAATIVRLVFAGLLSLDIDEAYMVAAGRHLQLSYFDHPPAAWWLSWGAAHLFGSETALAVRAPFILMYALTTWLVYRLGAYLFSPAAGLWAAVLATLAPVLGVAAASWVGPDGPVMCALAAAALCLAHALFGPQKSATAWWLGAGVCAGLALFSKYTAFLVLAGALIYLLSQGEHRKWLLRPQPYLAGLLAAAVFAPVLVWNAQHQWVSFAFQGARAGWGRLHPDGPFTTFGGEALYLLPWIWLPMMAAFVGALRRGPRQPRTWLLACLASLPVLVFPLAAIWSRTHVLFHWAGPGYLLLTPLVGEAITRRAPAGQARARTVAIGTGAFVLALFGVYVSEVRWNWAPTSFQHGAPKWDPNLEAGDWSSLPAVFAQRGYLGRPNLVFAGTDWRDIGKLDYVLGGRVPVTGMDGDVREYRFQGAGEPPIGADVIIFGPRRPELADLQTRYAAQFDAVEALAPAPIVHAGRLVTTMPLYLGHRYRGGAR
jgi:4-amino-4-deoxy-L-arabinose transferase-like glycosyltransferase